MVRIVPQFIDYIIFFIQLTILGSYFYVAYIWDGLNDIDCKADINNNTPLKSDASNLSVNVSKHFSVAIRWGFWMSLLTFVRAILAQIGLCMRRWVLLWCSYVLFAVNITISIILFIFMQIWRWSHAGQVCSGDLKEYNEADKDDYLIFEGFFIKVMLITVYSILGLSFFSIFIVAICAIKRHSEEDKQYRAASESGNQEIMKRQSAFSKALDPDYEAAMRETTRSEMKKKFFNPDEMKKGDDTALLL